MKKTATISGMGRPKNENREERVAVQIPKSWMAVARKLAAESKQPLLWFLLAIIADKADSAEIDHPPLPWEIDGE